MAVTSAMVAVNIGRPLSSSEQRQADRWISNALRIIEKRLGDPADLNQEDLEYVVVEAVTLRLRNPDSIEEERVDDYSYKRSRVTAGVGVRILDEWWELLTPTPAGSPLGSAFSITPA